MILSRRCLVLFFSSSVRVRYARDSWKMSRLSPLEHLEGEWERKASRTAIRNVHPGFLTYVNKERRKEERSSQRIIKNAFTFILS